MNFEENLNFLGKIINNIGIYAIPYISGFGFVSNLICFAVLVNPVFKHNIYTFLLGKCVYEMIGCFNMIFFQNLLCVVSCTRNFSQWYNLFVHYGLKCLGDICYVGSALCEVTLAYDRYLTLNGKTNAFSQIKPAILIVWLSVFSFVAFIPDFLAYHVIDISANLTGSSYAMLPTWFGNSEIYSVYMIAVLMTEGLVTITCLISLNVLVIASYKEFISKKLNQLRINPVKYLHYYLIFV